MPSSKNHPVEIKSVSGVEMAFLASAFTKPCLTKSKRISIPESSEAECLFRAILKYISTFLISERREVNLFKGQLGRGIKSNK
jgi:hypothetical protein